MIEGKLSKPLLEYTPEEFLVVLLQDTDDLSYPGIFEKHQPHVLLKYKLIYIQRMLDRVKFWYMISKDYDTFKANYVKEMEFDNSDDMNNATMNEYIRFLNDVSRKYNMVLSPIMSNFAYIMISGNDGGEDILNSDSEPEAMYDMYRNGKYKSEKRMEHALANMDLSVMVENPRVLGSPNSRYERKSSGAGRGKGGKGLGVGSKSADDGSWVSPPEEF